MDFTVFVEKYGIFLLELVALFIQMLGLLVYIVRNEIRVKSRLDVLEKDYIEFKLNVKEHDLTLWGKIDGIKTDISQMLQALARLEVWQEYNKKRGER